MKLYKARNGNYDRSGKALDVFVVAGSDEEAEVLAKGAFDHHPGLPSERGAYIRLHAITEDLTQPGTSGVWGLPADD